jgi:AraC-like DNA-binding protein
MPIKKRVSSQLHLPTQAMAGYVYLGVERDTRGMCLTDRQRFNFYPASPFPTISWIFEGELHLVEDLDSARVPRISEALPRVLFAGPQSKPSASWSSGEVHAWMVSFYPDALFHLFGLTAEVAKDEVLPLDHLLSAPLLHALQQTNASHACSPIQHIETALGPVWRDLEVRNSASNMRRWLRFLANQATFTKAGRGVRQLQRLVRDWTGQSLRDLELFSRVEEAFALSQRSGLQINWMADVAIDAGYSDQSHLGREVKRVTGFSPKLFSELVKTDEAFWMYRLLGEYLRE